MAMVAEGSGGDAMTMMRTAKSAPACLLVEDEPLICDIVTEALAEQGFEVEAVSNAGDALRHLLAGAPVDILFTDVNLPGGMDGAALAQRARELRPDLPVMYTSGRRSVIEQLDPVDGSMFVPKPYNPYEVGRLLDYLVAARRDPSRLTSSRLGEELLQPVDVVVAVDDVLLAHQRAEQRQRRLDAVDHELVERALEPHQAFAARLAVHDELADERVVDTAGSCSRDRRRNRRARRGRRADDRARSCPGEGRNVTGFSALMRHSMAWPWNFTSSCVSRELAAGGDADLLEDEVDVGDRLGHRMLDLDARVHLDEIELAVLVQELDRADAEIFELAHRLRDGLADRCCAAATLSAGEGPSSQTFWWRRCSEQSRSPRWMARPWPSPSTWISMWRGRSRYFSR